MVPVSYSRWSTYQSCKEMYRQVYHIPLEESEHELTDGLWAAIGQAKHMILEEAVKNELTMDDITEFLDDCFNDLNSVQFCIYDEAIYFNEDIPEEKRFRKNVYLKVFPTYFAEVNDYIKDVRMARNVFKKQVKANLENVIIKMVELGYTQNAKAEVMIERKYDGYRIKGVIDLLVETEDGCVVLDYKRKYNPDYHTDEQMLFYVILLKKKISKMGYWCLKENKIHFIRVTKSRLKEIRQSVLEFKEDVVHITVDKELTKKVGGHCKFCPINSICKENNS